MLRLFHLSLIAGLCASYWLQPAEACAQSQTAVIEGKIRFMQGATAQVVTEKNSVYMVAVEPTKTKLTIYGSADPTAVRVGMLVRFNAVLNEKGVGEKPIDKLTIFTPYPNASIGVFKEADSMFVAGEVRTIKDGTLTVAAGKHQITVELGENAKVDLELSNLALAKPQAGDDIKVVGQEIERGKIVADSVEITLASPVGGAAKRGGKTQPAMKTPATRNNPKTNKKPAR